MPPKEHSNKYLCTICNIWIADNRAQREQHEAGQKHKTAKVRLLKEIAKKNAARRSERPEAVAHAAAQQLLEHVAKSVSGADKGKNDICEESETVVEGGDAGGVKEVIGVDQAVDQNGFPVSAKEMYTWRECEQDEGDYKKQDDYIPTGALGEFAPDEPEGVAQDNEVCETEKGHISGNMTESVDNKVQEEQDPEERKLIQNAFKKRSAPRNRRKRRAR